MLENFLYNAVEKTKENSQHKAVEEENLQTLNDKMTFQGIVAKFDFVSPRKISQILPGFKYNYSVSTQSHDILANYVASSVQWYNVLEH